MPTRKIDDLPQEQICQHPDHNPPQLMYYPDGVYEHFCPSCGKRTVFKVESPRLNVKVSIDPPPNFIFRPDVYSVLTNFDCGNDTASLQYTEYKLLPGSFDKQTMSAIYVRTSRRA
jgi:hypothetical protein